MRCTSCGFENEANHKFCAECGVKLARTCPSCGAETTPGHKFCHECGTGLTDAPPSPTATTEAIPAERRVVTSVFCDLVGFTSFSESRDPEQVREMLTRYFDVARESIERFGGVVDKFIGDAVTAFWGAAIAEPDDAERAVRAALDLVEQVAGLGEELGIPDLALRAGVLTGETAVGPGGNEKGLVLGDVVNTASRLQSIAAPGTVAVGDSTKQLTDEAITYEDLGERELKGKEAPVRVWRAVRVSSTRGGHGRRDGLEPPFVGRDHELRILKDLLHVTGAEKRGRLVSVVGEAGIGKSRLAWEFLKYVDGLAEPVYWHQGRSPAYVDGVTFWSLGEMIRRRAGITESDDPHRARTRLRTMVVEYVHDPEEQRWIEPRLAGLLGLDEMPVGDQTELYAALRTFFHRIAEQGATVLVFEDLHWADAGLYTFIEELVDRSPHHPILVVTLARPDLFERAEGWGSGRRLLTALHLGPIADTAMRDLVAGTVPGLGSDLTAAIVDRAGGTPLYAVEMIRTLLVDGTITPVGDGTYRVEGDIGDIAVPDSLHSAIGARIDRLDPTLRTLVKDASVLGQSFTADGLEVVTTAAPDTLQTQLDDLVRAEIFRVEDDPRSPERGQYQFVQSLIREVAYGRLTLAERKARHLAVAGYFETIDDVEVAGVVASHLLDAHRADPDAADADELAAKAIAALTRAARRAADLHSHRQVLTLTDRALDIAADDAARGEIQLLAAEAARTMQHGEDAVARASAALESFRAVGDTESALRAITLAGLAQGDQWRPDDALATLEPAFERHPDPKTPAEIDLAAALARSLMMAARHDDAIRVADSALPRAELDENLAALVDLLITKGTSLTSVLRKHEGTALLRAALAMAENGDLISTALRAHNNLGVVLTTDSELDEAENQRAAWLKAKTIGDPRWLYSFALGHAADLLASGRPEEAAAVEASLDLEAIPEEWAAYRAYNHGWDAMRHGDLTAGCDTANQALKYWANSQDAGIRSIVGFNRAQLSLYSGRFAESYEQAMAVERIPGRYPTELEVALIAAIWLDDADKIIAVGKCFDTVRERGRLVALLRVLAAAAAAHVSGEADRASTLAADVLDDTDNVWLPDSAAAVKAAIARLIGLDDSVGARAGAEAEEWYRQAGATNRLRLFAAAFPTEPEAQPTAV